MLEWLRGHGVDDAILVVRVHGRRRARGCSATAPALGIRLRYVEEPRPLGTGGALKFAEDLLDERFFMLNGDVLTDIDLTAQLRQHEQTGARVTLALIGVEDPSAYGLVRRDEDGSVTEFVEKPSPDEIDTNLINARRVHDRARACSTAMPPAGTKLSIERDVFPKLVGDGLYGYEASGYWLDIGTPAALPAGDVRHPRGQGQHRGRPRGSAASGLALADSATDRRAGERSRPVLVAVTAASVAAGAIVGGRGRCWVRA